MSVNERTSLTALRPVGGGRGRSTASAGRANARFQRGTSSEEDALEHGTALLIMVVLGVLTIAWFGFCCDAPLYQAGVDELATWGLLHREEGEVSVSHWRSWEMGAVVWSFYFLFYYYFTFPFLRSETSNKLICLGVGVVALACIIWAAWCILGLKAPAYHVLAILAIAFLYLLTDFVLYRKLEDPNHRGTFFESVLMADAPVVIGSIGLLLYLLLHGEHGTVEEMDAFTGGAISFQLIASNVIFVVSQGGCTRLLRRPKEAGERRQRPEACAVGDRSGRKCRAQGAVAVPQFQRRPCPLHRLTLDGSSLAAGTEHSVVLLWDQTKQMPKSTMPDSRNRSGPVRALAFSKDGRYVAAALGEPGLVVWDTQTDEVWPLVAASTPAAAISLSLDAWTLASGRSDGTLSTWRGH